MTREEIISGLEFTVEMFLFNPSTGEKYTEPRNDMDKTTIDACRGAIELLKQEPTTKNDLGVDCISRADAIKAMQDKAKELKNEDTINGLCGAVAILFDMPSVTPQEPVKKLEEQIKQLQNRCHALTHGQICVFCLYECEHKAESEG